MSDACSFFRFLEFEPSTRRNAFMPMFHPNPSPSEAAWLSQPKLPINLDSGGGTSGRAIAFCLGNPGLDPGMDLFFFSSELLSI